MTEGEKEAEIRNYDRFVKMDKLKIRCLCIDNVITSALYIRDMGWTDFQQSLTMAIEIEKMALSDRQEDVFRQIMEELSEIKLQLKLK